MKDHVDFKKLNEYISKGISRMGAKVIYTVLLLFHAFKREETPFWAKNIILASIGYFLSPIDSIPDLTPFLGFTDDFSVMLFGAVTIACYINDEVRLAARKSLSSWIKDYDQKALDEVDARI